MGATTKHAQPLETGVTCTLGPPVKVGSLMNTHNKYLLDNLLNAELMIFQFIYK